MSKTHGQIMSKGHSRCTILQVEEFYSSVLCRLFSRWLHFYFLLPHKCELCLRFTSEIRQSHCIRRCWTFLIVIWKSVEDCLCNNLACSGGLFGHNIGSFITFFKHVSLIMFFLCICVHCLWKCVHNELLIIMIMSWKKLFVCACECTS